MLASRLGRRPQPASHAPLALAAHPLPAAAAQFAVGSTMPEVTYLTTLDKYQLFSTLVVLLYVVESGVLGFYAHPDAMALPACGGRTGRHGRTDRH